MADRIDDTHIVVDWPRSIGFFGAIGAAVALDLVSMPIAVFVAAVPFLKLMNRPNAPKPQQFFSHLVDGAAKPVGGDSEGTVRWAPKAMRAQSNRARRSHGSARSKVSRTGSSAGKSSRKSAGKRAA